MRELYKEFFHVPKHGKVREKVMLARTAITVIIMVICLAAMSITAYAYFSYNVTSGSNIIKAANFKADVSIIEIADESGTTVSLEEVDSLTYSAKLYAGKTYTVKLEPGESTAKTGFCVIKAVGCSDTYHTQQFGKEQTIEANDPSVTFTLTVTQDTVVSFISHWGTSSYYDNFKNNINSKLYITNGTDGKNNLIEMVINGVVNSISDTGEGDGTTPSETAPTETTPTEVTYTVQSGDTLESIAKEYDTTAEKIAAYNNLADKNTIVVGQQLKIPPADYEIPADSTETTTPSTTTPTESTTVTEPTTTTTVPETTTTTEPTETTAPAETTTEATTETTGTTEPTATTETQPAATSTEPASTETTGTTTTEASE